MLCALRLDLRTAVLGCLSGEDQLFAFFQLCLSCQALRRSLTEPPQQLPHVAWVCSGPAAWARGSERALEFLRQHARVSSLRLRRCLPLPADFARLLALPGIREVECMATLLSDVDVCSAVAKCGRSLQSLKLTHCTGALSCEALAAIGRCCPQLRTLRISHVEAEDDVVCLRAAAAQLAEEDRRVLFCSPRGGEHWLIYPLTQRAAASETASTEEPWGELRSLQLSHCCWGGLDLTTHMMQKLMFRNNVATQLHERHAACRALANDSSGRGLLADLHRLGGAEHFALLCVQRPLRGFPEPLSSLREERERKRPRGLCGAT